MTAAKKPAPPTKLERDIAEIKEMLTTLSNRVYAVEMQSRNTRDLLESWRKEHEYRFTTEMETAHLRGQIKIFVPVVESLIEQKIDPRLRELTKTIPGESPMETMRRSVQDTEQRFR